MITQIRSFMGNRRESHSFWAAIWYTSGTFIEKGVSFAFVLIFAGLLTPAEFGSVSIFITWEALFLTVLTLNVSSSIQRAEFDFSANQRDSFLSSTLVLGTIGPVLGLLVVSLIPNAVNQDLFSLDATEVQLAIISAAGVFALSVLSSSWRARHLYRRYTLISLGQTLARLLVSLTAIYFLTNLLAGDSGLARILGITTVDLILGVYLLVATIGKGRTVFNADMWHYALSFSIPLIPHTISGLLLAQFDRVMIAKLIGTAEAGIYSFAYQIGEIVRYVWLACNAAWTPWLFAQLNKGSHEIVQHRSRQYIMGFTLISAISMILIPAGMILFAPDQYQRGVSIMPLIMAGGHFTFLYALYAAIEFYEKKTWFISLGTILSAVINVALNWFLLPIYGYRAAAWITAFAYFLMMGFHMLIVTIVLKKSNLVPNVWVLLSGSIIAILMFVAYALY